MALTILLAWLLSFYTEKQVPAARRIAHDWMVRYRRRANVSA
jgi:hypothetical protein